MLPYNATFIPDGLPYVTWQPEKWECEVRMPNNQDVHVQDLFGWTTEDVGLGRVGLRWLKSGKYKQAIMKGHLIIGLHSLILKHPAHLGVDNAYDTGVMHMNATPILMAPRQTHRGGLGAPIAKLTE